MTMSTSQGELWRQIIRIYHQWDPDRNRLMPVKKLNDMLPAVPAEMIGDTLAQARADQLAELDNVDRPSEFRPLRH
jgi:hypothetical protein